jgi:hypothetical protein
MTIMNYKDRLDALLDWYGALTLQSVAEVGRFYASEARFKDPFNDVRGHAAISRVYQHMFAATTAPQFVIGKRMLDGDHAFVTWTFRFGMKGKQYAIVGASQLCFDADGLVVIHRDYWDAAEELLQKLPLIGAPIRWLRCLFVAR